MAIQHNFHLPIVTEDDLREFIRLAFGVKLPDVQVCADHTTPWRAFCDAYFAKSPVAVWKASRGFGGKSFTLALLGLTMAVTRKADVSLLGGSGEQSRRILAHMNLFWNYRNAPRDLLKSDPTRQETKLSWGNIVQALMASQAGVRGPHPQKLLLDEADEMELSILDAALGQPMTKGDIIAQTIISSTHQYANGTMTEVLRRAGERGWPVYTWCYKETAMGWLSQEMIEQKRNTVTARMWSTEYDLQEPSPESRAIMPEKVDAMFRPELGVFVGKEREYIEIEPPWSTCPSCGYGMAIADGKICPSCHAQMQPATYINGGDWARKKDWTIIITARTDCKPMKLVAFERLGRRPWPDMVGRYDQRVMRYPGQSFHDGTGLGDVVDGYLTVGATGVQMVGRERKDILSNAIGIIEREEIISPVIEFMKTELKFASVDDVYGSGHLPDCLSALALTLKGASGGSWFLSSYD